MLYYAYNMRNQYQQLENAHIWKSSQSDTVRHDRTRFGFIATRSRHGSDTVISNTQKDCDTVATRWRHGGDTVTTRKVRHGRTRSTDFAGDAGDADECTIIKGNQSHVLEG